MGVQVVAQDEALSKDIVCNPTIGDAEDLGQLSGQTVFGWIHAVQNREIADALLQGKLTVSAWEDMFEEGRHSSWKNNEIAEKRLFITPICDPLTKY